MRARLAVYAHISPSEFGALTPARTRELNSDVTAILDEQLEVRIELAKLARGSGLRLI